MKLLLIGATVFQRDDSGKLTAKKMVIDYVEEFFNWFDQVIWATSLFEGKAHTRAIIDEQKVSPCILRIKAGGLLPNYLMLRGLIDRLTVVFLHLPNVWLVPIVLTLRQRARGLFVYVANDYIQYSEISRETKGVLHSKVFKIFHELPIRMADGVIVRGKLNQKRARQLNPNVINTMPIGLTEVLYKRMKEPCSGDLIRILYVGKLVKSKGVEVLLRAFSDLCERLRNKWVLLTVVGTGSEEENLKKMSQSLGVDEKIKFLGFIDDKYLLSKLYAQADVVVVPSTYPEGVPRVIDEALLHGTPVVASIVGGIPEQFSEKEIVLVAPGRTEELVAALLKLISDKLYRAQLLGTMEMRVEKIQRDTAANQHATFIMEHLE